MTRLLVTALLSLTAQLQAQPRISNIAITSFDRIPEPAAAVDVDGDGDRDLLLYNTSSSFSHVAWMEHTEDNTFLPPQTLSYISGYAIHHADLDSDGQIEILGLQLSNFEREASLRIASPITSESQSDFKVVGHWKNNGIPHLVDLEKRGSSNILVETTDGSGDFRIHSISKNLITPWNDVLISAPDGATVSGASSSDLDNDGDLDLILTLQQPRQTAIYQRIGEKEFSESPVIIDTDDIALIDIDSDNDIDLLDLRSSKTTLIRQGADFTFSTEYIPRVPDFDAIRHDAGRPTRLLATEEEDQEDGTTTVTIAEFELSSEKIWVQHLEQTVSIPSIQDLNKWTDNSPSLLDIDGDGSSELILSASFYTDTPSYLHRSIVEFYQREDSGWGRLSTTLTSNPISYISPKSGDFTGDGSIDLIVGPDLDKNYHLLINDGLANFTLAAEPLALLPPNLSPEDYEIAGFSVVDLDKNGNPDLSISYQAMSNPAGSGVFRDTACSILYGRGDGTFIVEELPTDIFNPIAPHSCLATDFIDWDMDGDLDAIFEGGWRENIDGQLSQFMRVLISNISSHDALGNPVQLTGSIVGDVDGDGAPDYIAPFYEEVKKTVYGSRGNYEITDYYVMAVAFNDGHGRIEELRTIKGHGNIRGPLGNPIIPPFGIFDDLGDGTQRIVVPESTSDALGNLLFERFRRLHVPKSSPRDLESGFYQSFNTLGLPDHRRLRDFNGDGILDYTGVRFFWTPNSKGTLISPHYDFSQYYRLHPNSFSPGGYPLLEDFDGDGDLDAIYGSGSQTLTLVRNLLVDERSMITQQLRSEGITPLSSTPTSDPDEDGLTNEEEFLLGTDPLSSDAPMAKNLAPQMTKKENSLTLNFLRRKDAKSLQLNYGFERSVDLKSWEPVSLDEAETTSLDATWEQVETNVPISDGLYFYRTNPQHKP